MFWVVMDLLPDEPSHDAAEDLVTPEEHHLETNEHEKQWKFKYGKLQFVK